MKRAGIIVAAGVVLLAAFILLRPKPPTPEPTPSIPPTSTASPSVTATFTFGDGRMEGPATVTVPLGEVVAVTVTSDIPGTVHLHGYEVMSDVSAGAATTLVVAADEPGRFPVEFHGEGNTQALVTELEVQP